MWENANLLVVPLLLHLMSCKMLKKLSRKILIFRYVPTNRFSLFLALCYESSQKILKKSLRLRPYQFGMVQKLHPPDYLQRIQFCNWYNNNLLDNVDQQDITFFSDEAWFHLSGFINSQHYRTWSAHNPHNVIQVPLHPLKIGVWVAMSRRRIQFQNQSIPTISRD
jgi:hypothetical protein